MAGRLPHAKLCAMLRVLQRHPATFNHISRKTNIVPHSVRLWVRALHAAKCVHVKSWTREGMSKTWVAVYAIGEGEDAKLSDIKLTKAQRNRKYRLAKQTLVGAWPMPTATPEMGRKH